MLTAVHSFTGRRKGTTMNEKKNDKSELNEVSLDELETASGGCAACRGQGGSGGGSQAAMLGLLTQGLAKK